MEEEDDKLAYQPIRVLARRGETGFQRSPRGAAELEGRSILARHRKQLWRDGQLRVSETAGERALVALLPPPEEKSRTRKITRRTGGCVHDRKGVGIPPFSRNGLIAARTPFFHPTADALSCVKCFPGKPPAVRRRAPTTS